MEIFLLLISGSLNIVCFFIGAKIGQTVAKGEKIEMPTINPLEVMRQSRAKKEAEREQQKYDAILDNVNNYDGSSYGQKDIPGG